MTTIEFNNKLTNESSLLKNFALKLTRNSEDAGDLVQETYLKALRNQDKFADETNLRAWLMTIMKNIFINGYNRNTKKNSIIEEKKQGILSNRTYYKNYNNAEMNINVKQISKQIADLKDEFRIPFIRHFEGFKYEEIAEELNVPVGTVKSRIFLARKKLMEGLEDLNG